MRKGMSESLSFINAMFAVSMAVSLPAAPIAIPTVLCANAGASFIPSPTIATFLYCSKRSFILSALFSGNIFPNIFLMPTFSATKFAAFSWSPVSIIGSMFRDINSFRAA
ncbi:MAG: hypothetical protein BWZ05_02356 [Bacteroidetes bacterium ADurb.BinA245]|nr:MAG: hypothetical protein BWZ05_02356 [Bacteroidetes bacterium ADurb.BinA245]